MTEIFVMTRDHEFWEKTAALAEHCSWRAGAHLAQKMRDNDFAEWERVFAAVEDGEVVGFCTLTEKDELPARYDFSPFIGFVFVSESHRGKRLSGQMIDAATYYARTLGNKKIYVMSGERGLYEKFGFEPLGDFPTIHGTTERLFARKCAVEKT